MATKPAGSCSWAFVLRRQIFCFTPDETSTWSTAWDPGEKDTFWRFSQIYLALSTPRSFALEIAKWRKLLKGFKSEWLEWVSWAASSLRTRLKAASHLIAFAPSSPCVVCVRELCWCFFLSSMCVRIYSSRHFHLPERAFISHRHAFPIQIRSGSFA